METQIEKISRLPAWLTKGGGRDSGLGANERLIRITSGESSGELAIVCLTDPPSDPESTESVRQVAYTQSDWEHECAPSLGFDGDGDLVWFTADGDFGSEPVDFVAVEIG